MPPKNVKINFNKKITNIKTINKRLIPTQKHWANQWCQLGGSVLLNNNFNPKQSVWGNLNGPHRHLQSTITQNLASVCSYALI